MSNEGTKHGGSHHHHILPNATAMAVGLALLFLTGVTVWVAGVDLGRLNFLVAILVASVKATLVALFFMNLLYDRRENGVIFGTSFLFLAIFFVLTATDLFFRGDIAVKGSLSEAMSRAQPKSQLQKPWIGTPQLVSRGKELYAQQCVSCHGPDGRGDGPAAGSLNPPPRNFTTVAGWKNPRKPSGVYKVLKEGVPGTGMPPFGTLPSDDRWALVHYVLSLGPSAEADSDEDLMKVGVDVKGGGEEVAQAPTIPIELAMERLTRPEPRSATVTAPVNVETPGGQLFAARCASCHGASGEGGVAVAVGGVPKIVLKTAPLNVSQAVRSAAAFSKLVVEGHLSGVAPGFADLGASQVEELHRHVEKLVSAMQ